jgi:hypothetical protein
VNLIAAKPTLRKRFLSSSGNVLDHVMPGGLRQKTRNTLFVTEERFHFSAQFNVTRASVIKKCRSGGCIKIKGLIA